MLRYYYAAQQCALELTGSGYDRLAELRKDFGLSARDIASHIEWLDICRENSHFTKVDAKEFALKGAE